MTNYEKIKTADVEELADILDKYFGQICMAVGDCRDCPLCEDGECISAVKWLKSEYE